MKKFEVFTAEDFGPVSNDTMEYGHLVFSGKICQILADRANRILNERGKRVTGFPDDPSDNICGVWGPNHVDEDTHEALLIGEREIKEVDEG